MKIPPARENPDLKKFILRRIRDKGRITFSEFMELCLYHPVHGYYQTKGQKIGKDGDYYTSPCVHPVFGRLLGRQLMEMDSLLGEEAFWILEAGAGRGTLAADILDSIARESPRFFERIEYGIVEKSNPFREEQKDRLASYEDRVHWLDPEAACAQGLQGCVVANEFFDAFPAHRVVVEDGRLLEIYVTEEEGGFREVFDEPSTAEIVRYFDQMGVSLAEGQKAEINLQALGWYDRLARILSRGFFLTIDYGYLAEELYDAPRLSGTLLCYYRHTCSDNPYAHIGLQDMTTHVNFTGLIKKGESLGFRLAGLVPQYRFLLCLGFLEELEKRNEGLTPRQSLVERLTMKHLILPEGGMGDTFKVLIQYRGLDRVQLTGLRPLSAVPA
ncbi:MAG: SAM-dependent methyltransferase [Deltaproteobacteria bacterium]|nr:SAM-dependent methyltransferase [Deltaproteobacteria bacterium]MBW2121746.1 SAM-dependent methyltransferase [Deltaproteobacteria bacterium]